jgi:hypothetical protein
MESTIRIIQTLNSKGLYTLPYVNSIKAIYFNGGLNQYWIIRELISDIRKNESCKKKSNEIR